MTTGIILLFLSAIEATTGLILLFRYQRSLATLFYGLFAFSAALYTSANGIGYIGWAVGVAESLAWLSGILLATFFLCFTLSFPQPTKRIGNILPLIIWPTIVFIPGIFLTDSFIHHRTTAFDVPIRMEVGEMMWLYVVAFSIYWIWSFINLVIRYRKSDGYYRWFIRVLLIGIISSLAVSSYFDIYVPITSTYRFQEVGSLFTAVWVIITGYIMLKK